MDYVQIISTERTLYFAFLFLYADSVRIAQICAMKEIKIFSFFFLFFFFFNKRIDIIFLVVLYYTASFISFSLCFYFIILREYPACVFLFYMFDLLTLIFTQTNSIVYNNVYKYSINSNYNLQNKRQKIFFLSKSYDDCIRWRFFF